MRLTSTALLSLMIAWLIAPGVHAEVRFSMSLGRVVIVAKDASLAEILAEWGRIGQTEIVNADQLPHDPVTLELQNVGEADALAVLLRSAPAYLAQSRAATDPSASLFERIVIVKLSAVQPMPDTSTLRAAAPAASPTPREPMPSVAFEPRRAPADDDAPPAAAPPIALIQPRSAPAIAAENPNEANANQPPPVVATIDPEALTAAEAAQSSRASHRALEVSNPRDFHLPTPARSTAPRSPTPKRP